MNKLWITLICLFLVVLIIGCVIYPQSDMQGTVDEIKRDFSPVFAVFNTVTVLAKQFFTNGEFRDIPVDLQTYLQGISSKGRDEYYDFQWFLLYAYSVSNEYSEREVYRTFTNKNGETVELCAVRFTFEYNDFGCDPFDIYVLFSITDPLIIEPFEPFEIYGVYLPKYKVVGNLLDIPATYSLYYGRSDCPVKDIETSGWIDVCFWRSNRLFNSVFTYNEIINRITDDW